MHTRKHYISKKRTGFLLNNASKPAVPVQVATAIDLSIKSNVSVFISTIFTFFKLENARYSIDDLPKVEPDAL